MGLTRFCTHCWAKNPWEAERCVRCQAPLSGPSGEDYVDKLISALRHPEASTPIRAAALLGQIADRRAVEPLRRLALDAPDPYIARAAVLALAAFNDAAITDVLGRVAAEGAVPARKAARDALASRERGNEGGSTVKEAQRISRPISSCRQAE